MSEASDEVARLGKTLNEMLARIEDGLARERRFVADASHELRTPLAMLKAELELALRRARSPEELERSIRSAAQETDRLARIADDLLLLARTDHEGLPIQPEPTDLVDLLETVSSRFSTRAETEGRSLSVESAAAPVASVDRLRLEQALGNLVDNAFRYGRGPITLSAQVADSTVELHVLDGGPGFPAAFREHAFERFSRSAEPGEEGSGLGLAIVETIARAHGGARGRCRPPRRRRRRLGLVALVVSAPVEELLLEWFQAQGRDLPWRRTRDPYAILVSEVMLQQTQVARVVPRYLAFLERWPTAEALAAASPAT